MSEDNVKSATTCQASLFIELVKIYSTLKFTVYSIMASPEPQKVPLYCPDGSQLIRRLESIKIIEVVAELVDLAAAKMREQAR